MAARSRSRGSRSGARDRTSGARALPIVVAGLGAWVVLAAPFGCLYPSDFTFDEPVSPAAGSGGGAAGVENCLNGNDDDGDGAIDCADDECAPPAYQCISTAPVGWNGYFSLYLGAPGTVPECPAAFPSTIPFMGMSGPLGAPASCSMCTCGASQGEACDLPDLITVNEKSCPNQAMATSPNNLGVPANWDGSCYNVGTAPGGQMNCGALMTEKCNTAVKSAAPTTTGGTCMPSGGEAMKSAVTWEIAGKACGDAPAGGGCLGGEVCQPASSGSFLSGLCIYKDGEQAACPGAPFSEKHVLYADAEDTRSCAACNCSAPQGGVCSANITVFSDAGCTANPTTFAAGNCASLGAMNLAVVGRTASGIVVTPGSCAPSGGEPIGTVAPITATTFCCVP
jgi:hypothetical protein